MRRIRVILIFLLLSLICSEGRTQVTNLSPAFRLKKQEELRGKLKKGECAVFFSGRFLPAGSPAGPLSGFSPSADFFFLTGSQLSDAVLVILADSVSWEKHSGKTFLFTSCPEEYRKSGYAGIGVKADLKGVVELAASEWGRFCGQVLAGPGVKKVYLCDDYLVESGSNKALVVNDLESVFFSKLPPGYPYTKEAALLYREIQNSPESGMDELRQKVASFTSFYGFPLGNDPILKRAVTMYSQKDLQEIRSELATLKTDLAALRGMMASISQKKSAEEWVEINKSKALITSVYKLVTNNLKVGQSEAEVAAFASQKVAEGNGELTRPVKIAAGAARTYPLGDANRGVISETVPGGKTVVIEIVCQMGGYPMGICRTITVNGLMSPAETKVSSVLKEAHQEFMNGLKPGVVLTDWVASRGPVNDKRLKSAGIYKSDAGPDLAPLFHQAEVMGTRLGSETLPGKLEPGMLLYVKTGVYFQAPKGINLDYTGCSMETGDMVKITETGFEVLTEEANR